VLEVVLCALGYAENLAVWCVENLAVGFVENLAVESVEDLAVGWVETPAVGSSLGCDSGLVNFELDSKN
jgi:hypothetical protein